MDKAPPGQLDPGSTSQSPRWNESLATEVSGQYVVLMDNSIPSLHSTVDTYGIGGMRRPTIETDTLTTPKKSEQTSPQSVTMFPMLPGNSTRYKNETDSIAQEIIVEQGLPEIERGRFSSADRPVLGFGVDYDAGRSKTVAQERGEADDQRKPLHSYFHEGRRTQDGHYSDSPPGGIGGLLREQEKEAKKRQTFFQTSGRFTETTNISDDMEMMKTMRSRKPQIEPIKERSSHGGSMLSGAIGSSMGGGGELHRRALSPIEVRMPSRKERQYVNQLMNMEKSWKRQQEQIYRLEKKIKEMEEEQEDERQRFKRAIVGLKTENKRMRGPLKSIKKKAEEKDKCLKEGVVCLRINEKVIHNREVTVKDVSKLYKSEKKKARKLQRELEIKDRVHNYINQRIAELEQEQRDREAVLGPSSPRVQVGEEGNRDLNMAEMPTPYN